MTSLSTLERKLDRVIDQRANGLIDAIAYADEVRDLKRRIATAELRAALKKSVMSKLDRELGRPA